VLRFVVQPEPPLARGADNHVDATVEKQRVSAGDGEEVRG